MSFDEFIDNARVTRLILEPRRDMMTYGNTYRGRAAILTRRGTLDRPSDPFGGVRPAR